MVFFPSNKITKYDTSRAAEDTNHFFRKLHPSGFTRFTLDLIWVLLAISNALHGARVYPTPKKLNNILFDSTPIYWPISTTLLVLWNFTYPLTHYREISATTIQINLKKFVVRFPIRLKFKFGGKNKFLKFQFVKHSHSH